MAEEKDHSHEIGKLQAEVHTLNTLVSKLFEKFDAYIEKTQPKPMGVAGYIGIAVSILTIFTFFGGGTMYMINSANAPVSAQMVQLTQLVAQVQNNASNNAGQTQLLNKELSGIEKSVGSNEETLRWIIFTENLPKQITETQGRLNTLEMQMERIVSKIHINKEGK